MNNPSPSRSLLITGLSGLWLVAWLQSAASAQQAAQEPVDYQAHIDAAAIQLQTLDSKAAACLAAFEEESRESATARCQEFLGAIDGAELADYVARCEVLKAWRENFVLAAQQSDADNRGSAADLSLMVGIEFTCGEDALQKRTQFVTTAFNMLYGNRNSAQQANSEIARRLAELQFETTLSNERRLLQDAIRRQQSDRLLQNERQFDALEKEIIRQQIRN